MRLIGWVLLLSGSWSLWMALAEDEPLGTGGVLMIIAGAGLLSRRGRTVAAWIGSGLLTGLCLIAGAAFLAVGGLMLAAYGRILAEGVALPMRSVAAPLLFCAWGLLLILLAVGRLVRQYRASSKPPRAG